MANWTPETDSDGIVWLKLDKPDSSANVLSSDVLIELNEHLERFDKELPTGVVIYSGKKNGFVMGADINEFTTIRDADHVLELVRLGHRLMDHVEALPCPTVAAINGFCLGGGLELSLACDYRIAQGGDKRIFGLPEVQLGLHPGFGGTVRSVQILGVRPAMQLMLTGKPVTADKALQIGLIDAITDAASWRDTASAFIRRRPPKSRQPVVERLLGLPFIRPFIRKVLIRQVAAKARREHYPAPYAMIDLWARENASPKTGYDAEARSFAELFCSDTSRNLVRVFFLQNKLKSQGDKSAPPVEHVHVIGAGVMGGDIAAWCALQGLTVTLQDRELKYIEPALDRARKLFEKKIRNDDERSRTTERLTADVDGDGIPGADLIIEAIFEDLDAKQGLYREIQPRMKDGAILATNTSSIPLEDLRTVLSAPRRFIGLHFFNPVAQMMIVEIIRCEDTETTAVDVGLGFVKRIGKLPLECRSAPGFVVNRILAPYMGEAMALALEGVDLPVIDDVALAFGMPMGPLELVDSVGLDIALHVSKILGGDTGGDVVSRLQEMVDDGKLGRKSGEGFYRWVDGKAQKAPATGSRPENIEDRLILPMVNEAVACLDDGIVTDADLLDAGVIFGTGFAPFRGGPIQYARTRGIDAVVSRLEALQATHGDRFAPHPGWGRL